MNLPTLPNHTMMRPGQENINDPSLHASWLVLLRGAWLTLIILTLGIFFAILPVYLAQLQTPCAGTACGFQQLTPQQADTLKGMGLSLCDYTACTVALTLATIPTGCATSCPFL